MITARIILIIYYRIGFLSIEYLPRYGNQKNPKTILNIVRFAHPPEAGNNGTMEKWNIGYDHVPSFQYSM
jgi:hypothetical protein